MQIAYVSQDEVNRSLVAGMVRNGNSLLIRGGFAAPSPGLGDLCVYDVDHLQEALVVERLVERFPSTATAVHSFSLDADAVERLRRNGVRVFRRLEPAMFDVLCQEETGRSSERKML